MPSPTWFVRIRQEVFGPLSGEELKELSRRGALRANAQVSRDGTVWMTADSASDIPADQILRNTAPQSDWPSTPVLIGTVVVIGLAILFFGGLAFAAFRPASASISSDSLSDAKSLKPQNVSDTFRDAPDPDLRSVARLNLRWREATPELLPLVDRFTAEQRAALGLVALASGVDIYAARIELKNTGTVPIRVFPENLRVHFGQEAAGVSTIDAPQFLHATVLEPGQSASGLVTFIARLDIGAAIRLGSGTVSYADPTITVTTQ